MPHQTYLASYTDDKTPYTVNSNAEEAIRKLEETAKPLLKWFKDKKMKLNPDKYHVLLSGKEDWAINVANIVMKNSHNEK